MPTSPKSKAALLLSQTVEGGNEGPDDVCRNGATREEVAAGGLPHFTSLIFKPMPALTVAGRQEKAGIGTPVSDFLDGLVSFEDVVQQLLQKTIGLLGMEPYTRQAESNYGQQLLNLIAYIKAGLPQFVNFSVGFNPKEECYYLLLWMECDWEFEFYNVDLMTAWNALQETARYENARELLIRTLALLSRQCGVVFWFDIHGGYLMDQMLDEVGSIEEDLPFLDTEEEHKDYVAKLAAGKAAVADYTSGGAFRAQKEIEHWAYDDTITTEDLRGIASSFTELPALQKVVDKVCELVDNKVCIGEFCNLPALHNVDAINGSTFFDDDDSMDTVGLGDTLAIMWDEDDHLSNTYLEIVDATVSQSASEEPSVILRIDEYTSQIDFEGFLNKRDWPRNLQLSLSSLNTLLGDITGPVPSSIALTTSSIFQTQSTKN